jgi:hypothetical protein
MTPRVRLVAFLVVCLSVASGSVAYVLGVRSQQETASGSPGQPAPPALSSVESVPHIVFRSTSTGQRYGRVAMVPLSAPAGRPAFTSLSCDRVYAAMTSILCLASSGLSNTATVYPLSGAAGTRIPLVGTPSRARLSSDASWAATTTFVSGDSYAGASFSTRTVVTDLASASSADLETFTLVHEGRPITPHDRNFWGVTFADDNDAFYATVAFGHHTWLTRGSLRKRTLVTLREDAECPSLSPDGTKVAYKKRGDRDPGDWRLAVLDLATARETMLAEPRSVDDQVTWLDNERIMYGLPRDDAGGVQTDVWVARADGTGSPTVLVPDAWSPAVVR